MEAEKPPEPLAARMTPLSLDEFVGQEHILGPGKLLRRAVEADRVQSAILYGPPGSGKNALARLIASLTKSETVELNAVAAGVADIKKVLEQARFRLRHQGRKTLLILDEIHHFNRTQQDVLLPAVERGEVILIGLTTENPHFYVNAALLSRFTAYEYKPLTEDALEKILDNALSSERGLKDKAMELDEDARRHFLLHADGDARRLLNALELSALTTMPAAGVRKITLEVAEESIRRRSVRYDKSADEHYDHASAFIKSMRGSDPDAAVYWLAKMLTAGEDPRFLARRIIICASEDVGNADPVALMTAVAALEAVKFIGMPEGRIPLAQAAIYVACAPKSNAAYKAIGAAMNEVERGPRREVPNHLRDANMDKETRGHGEGYLYPHDHPGHWVEQEYMPQPVKLYEPSDQGREKAVAERLRGLGKPAKT